MLMGAASGEVVSLHERGPGGYTVSALTFSRFAYRPRHPSVWRAGSAAASSPPISPSHAHLVYVPGGHVRPAECITALPNRAVYNVSAAGAPRTGCETTASDSPAVQIYAADAHLKSAAPLTSLTADWVVPPLPKGHPIFGSQVVYFWPPSRPSAAAPPRLLRLRGLPQHVVSAVLHHAREAVSRSPSRPPPRWRRGSTRRSVTS